jgi:beta-lactam-binding protein with PASTA domain
MRLNLTRINRFFNILFGGCALLFVALLSAYLAMRFTIHGREVDVPNLTGLSINEAAKQASSHGLRLNLENRFYAPGAPAGQILAQSPAPGTRVRRQWAVRVTESLGPQQVAIPDLLGQSERLATIAIRRLPLELGTVAYLPASSDPDTVLAQTPNPNAEGVDRPRISLLLSQPPDPDHPQLGQPMPAYVMPSLAGLTFASAAARAAEAGLHIVSVEDLNNPTPPPAPAPATTPAAKPAPAPTPPASAAATATPAPAPAAPALPTFTMGTVVGQSPPAGHRVVKGDPVRLTLGH